MFPSEPEKRASASNKKMRPLGNCTGGRRSSRRDREACEGTRDVSHQIGEAAIGASEANLEPKKLTIGQEMLAEGRGNLPSEAGKLPAGSGKLPVRDRNFRQA